MTPRRRESILGLEAAHTSYKVKAKGVRHGRPSLSSLRRKRILPYASIFNASGPPSTMGLSPLVPGVIEGHSTITGARQMSTEDKTKDGENAATPADSLPVMQSKPKEKKKPNVISRWITGINNDPSFSGVRDMFYLCKKTRMIMGEKLMVPTSKSDVFLKKVMYAIPPQITEKDIQTFEILDHVKSYVDSHVMVKHIKAETPLVESLFIGPLQVQSASINVPNPFESLDFARMSQDVICKTVVDMIIEGVAPPRKSFEVKVLYPVVIAIFKSGHFDPGDRIKMMMQILARKYGHGEDALPSIAKRFLDEAKGWSPRARRDGRGTEPSNRAQKHYSIAITRA